MSNQNALYEITTRMDKKDYREFSYLTIFRKKTQTVLLIILLAAIGSGFAALAEGSFSAVKFLIIWVILIATAFAAIFLRVEYKLISRMNLIAAGAASAWQIITFYENYLIAEEDRVKGTNKIKYDKLYQVLETQDYYIIYASAGSASLIRKKDIDDEDKTGFHKFLQGKLGDRYKNLIKAQKA